MTLQIPGTDKEKDELITEMYEALKLYIEHQHGTEGHYCTECHNEIEKALAKVEGKNA